MDYALDERIGMPDLFTGRKAELKFFIKWIRDIKEMKSRSTALLARRKMGKTAVMERLFNITFAKNDGVIPFYYEIKEMKMWAGDFCKEFFLTFIFQYMAFKTRKPEYLELVGITSFDEAIDIAKKEGLEYLCGIIKTAAQAAEDEQTVALWNLAREAPKKIAALRGEFIVQMIDEFQFLNAMYYWDKKMTRRADDLAGGYLSTAESKIAPLLVSGSWVGWLMNELTSMLPARFKYEFLGNMPEDEAVEMIYKYSHFFDVPVTEETVYLMAELAEGSPFYISSIIRPSLRKKDLTTIDGLIDALEFETLDDRGVIKRTWMEYVSAAFPKINDRNAKNIVLHLCKNRDRELTRAEIIRDLKLDMTDAQLEKRMKALVNADIVAQGSSNFRYQGVKDNIFDKVFRGVYEEEIHEFDIGTIKKEYGEELAKLKTQLAALLGKYNYQKGLFSEYLILEQLRMHAVEKNEFFKSITRHLPSDFNFCDYSQVWRYDGSPVYAKRYNVDVFARATDPKAYSIIGEVKNRDTRKFSKEEAMDFERKFTEVKKIETIDRAVGFVFSRSGFTKDAEAYCQKRGIACSDDDRWLGD